MLQVRRHAYSNSRASGLPPLQATSCSHLTFSCQHALKVLQHGLYSLHADASHHIAQPESKMLHAAGARLHEQQSLKERR